MAWPSAFSPGTLGYMKDRIADEIARSDLDTQIAATINDAIAIYQKERFRFSETRDATFNTVIDQEFYTSADSPFINSIFFIDDLFIQVSPASQFRMPRYQPNVLESLSQQGTQKGQPYAFAYYNEQIRLYPVPSAVYTMRIMVHAKIAGPATDSEIDNRWMVDAERLIRARAKYELAINTTKDSDEAAMNSPYPPEEGQPTGVAWRALKELLGEANRLTARGMITATQF